MGFSRRAAETKKEVWVTERLIKAETMGTSHSAIKEAKANQNGTTPATTSKSRKMRSKARQRPLDQGTAKTNRVSANPRITDV
jgi:hypothetical protein